MRAALVFGGSGQIGAAVLSRLRSSGWRSLAVSREAQGDLDGVRWMRGDLADAGTLPESFDAIFSCGPLDLFAKWYAGTQVVAPRVVAFGSTSVGVKQVSSDPGERDLAARLGQAETSIFATAARRGAAATVLRPTLVYGAGRDRTLTRIAALASRWRCFVLPRDACGLRQPVHVDDLAAAACDACDATASYGRVYALPGGEALSYREMVRRVLASLSPEPALIEVPSPVFRLALTAARVLGGVELGEAAVSRLRTDLVFDAAPAQHDFRYAPRPFRPTAEMFVARG